MIHSLTLHAASVTFKIAIVCILFTVCTTVQLGIYIYYSSLFF